MPVSLQGNSLMVVAVLVFIAVMLLLESLYLMWASRKGAGAEKIKKRLQLLSTSFDRSRPPPAPPPRRPRAAPAPARPPPGPPRPHSLHRLINQAGLNWTVSRLLLSSAATGVIGYVAVTAFAYQPMWVGAMIGAGAATAPFLYVQTMRKRRLAKIQQQLPEAIDLMVSALRSGHAFSSGLQMIGEEMSEPAGGEFRIVHDEINFGVSLQQALTNLSERVPITDLRYFVVAVLIQRESGGNLTEVLGNLSRLIRDRLKLVAKVKVLSSDGRLSAWVLGVMPFALAAVMNIFNPGFMSPLWKDPIGIAIIQYMLSLMVIGVLILRKIIRFRV